MFGMLWDLEGIVKMAVGKWSENKLVYVLSFIGIGFFGAWGVLRDYWGRNAARAPNESSGMIYQLNEHGSFVYVTYSQYILTYALPLCGALVFLLVFYLTRKTKNDT